MRSIIPGTAREIVEHLIKNQNYTVKQIAEILGISHRTIYRIRKGNRTQPDVHLNLIQLYLNTDQPILEPNTTCN